MTETERQEVEKVLDLSFMVWNLNPTLSPSQKIKRNIALLARAALNAPARVDENAELLAAAKEFVHCVRRNTLPDDTTKNLGWLFGHMEWEHLCEAVDTAAARERGDG